MYEKYLTANSLLFVSVLFSPLVLNLLVHDFKDLPIFVLDDQMEIACQELLLITKP